MPVTVEWHTTLPILVTVYQGVLSAADYRTMRAQQCAALAESPKRIVLLADMRQLEGFPDADTIDLGDSLLVHPKVMGVVVVLDARLYDHLTCAILPANGIFRKVYFFKDYDSALNQAEARLRSAES